MTIDPTQDDLAELVVRKTDTPRDTLTHRPVETEQSGDGIEPCRQVVLDVLAIPYRSIVRGRGTSGGGVGITRTSGTPSINRSHR